MKKLYIQRYVIPSIVIAIGLALILLGSQYIAGIELLGFALITIGPFGYLSGWYE